MQWEQRPGTPSLPVSVSFEERQDFWSLGPIWSPFTYLWILLIQFTDHVFLHSFSDIFTKSSCPCHYIWYDAPREIAPWMRYSSLSCFLHTSSCTKCVTQIRKLWYTFQLFSEYKISTLVYKPIRLNEPSYVKELLFSRCCTRNLRSASMDLLNVPRTRTKTSDRTFSCAAPAVWNNLSEFTKSADSLNTFRNRLKTELFCLAYWHSYFFASETFTKLGLQLQLQLQLQFCSANKYVIFIFLS